MNEKNINSEENEPAYQELEYCVVSNKIMLEGQKIGFMYREIPDEPGDSGWRILSGTENQQYLDNPRNSGKYALKTIAEADPTIIPYFPLPVGTDLERIEGNNDFLVYEE